MPYGIAVKLQNQLKQVDIPLKLNGRSKKA